MRDIERRWMKVGRLEVRADDGGRPRLVGYAVRYNDLSRPIGGFFRERIAPGAFRSTLESGENVYALWQHDDSRPLARSDRGSLRLEDTRDGLRVEIDPVDTSWGEDARRAVEAGLVDEMSFMFSVRDGGDYLAEERSDDGLPIRVVTDAELFEVSPVTFAAYPSTSVESAKRAAGDVETARRTHERLVAANDQVDRLRLRLRQRELDAKS